MEQLEHEYDLQPESLREELDHLQEVEEALVEKRERLEENRHRYDVVKKTSAYLSEARARFTARYMEPIKASFDRYYAMLSGADGKEYQLDADLNIQAREQGALRDPAFLSEGYQDLIGLCRRLAMVDAMYEEEKPFLILDDPFVNLDDTRLSNAMEFLQKVSETYQVLYFTCHGSRVP